MALTYAGMFSRFFTPRCAGCCHARGITTGPGTPVNEVAEKRIKAERDDTTVET
ncbi:hypothetical protein [Nonomuraea jabiensis]|uniref:Uncharacterized protein n=1 Tax=Nonomuraea jabiensis TaxID=882448 RepID=A0A7W9GI28_9ACTN|nr:hypothetical protein [Nonomuraea jabiensis]MBB5784173.1 hypothetical protein [Nonomuraea jabiensis]